MVDRASDNLNFTCREVSLEVCGVILCVPQTELQEAEEIQVFVFCAVVLQDDSVNLAFIVNRNESLKSCFYIILGSCDDCVSKTVAAAVGIQLSLCRLPSRVPYGITIFNIVVTTTGIQRAVVVTVSGDTHQFCIFVERVSAGRIGDQAEEILRSKIVDPWQRCAWGFDDIFFSGVIKVSKFHDYPPQKKQ